MDDSWVPPVGLIRRDPAVVAFDYIEGPLLTDAMVASAERILGVRLPASYVRLMRECNGGYLVGDLGCPTSEPTSWAPDHVGVDHLNGIPEVHDPDPSDPWWDGGGILCSHYMSREWSLPAGLVLLAGDGHTWVALDYRDVGDEPTVAWIDVDSGQQLRLAPDFASFIDSLRTFAVLE